MPDPAKPTLHLVKLCVGTDTVEDLLHWQSRRSAERLAAGLDPRPRHVTRMWPRQADELLRGRSLYWVIRAVTRVPTWPVRAQAGVSRPHSRACVAATVTTRYLKDHVGFMQSFFR